MTRTRERCKVCRSEIFPINITTAKLEDTSYGYSREKRGLKRLTVPIRAGWDPNEVRDVSLAWCKKCRDLRTEYGDPLDREQILDDKTEFDLRMKAIKK